MKTSLTRRSFLSSLGAIAVGVMTAVGVQLEAVKVRKCAFMVFSKMVDNPKYLAGRWTGGYVVERMCDTDGVPYCDAEIEERVDSEGKRIESKLKVSYTEVHEWEEVV